MIKKIQVKKKYVLSIDVAIKHLAFCLLCNTKICDWKLIDLLEDNDLKCKCSGIKKNGVLCTNNAKWQSPSASYCDIHKTDDDTLVQINKKLTCHCGNLAKYITTDQLCNGFCERHKTVLCRRWYTVDNISDLELRILLFKKLDEFDFPAINITDVLIERQPKLATEKMRSLAYAIYDYFIIKFEYTRITVNWIDPKNKLYVYTGPIIQCPIKNQYDRNKWFACKYCLWNLNEKDETEYKNFFLDNKKQDDLADCYLQGLYYQQKQGSASKEMSAQQRNVYTEQNLIKYKKMKARKPNKTKSKILLAGIKYYISKREITQPVLDSIKFYFGDIEIEKLY